MWPIYYITKSPCAVIIVVSKDGDTSFVCVCVCVYVC